MAKTISDVGGNEGMGCEIASLRLRFHLSNLGKTERVFDCIEYLVD